MRAPRSRRGSARARYASRACTMSFGHVDAELGRLGEAVHEVERHVRRRRARRGTRGTRRWRSAPCAASPAPTSRSAAATLRVEHVDAAALALLRPPLRLAAATASPRAPSCGSGRRRRTVSSGVSRCATAPPPSSRPPGKSREDAGDDARRHEAVQRLLGALVRVVDQVRQRLQHGVEELRVDGDDHLLVHAASGRRSSPGRRRSASACPCLAA